MRIAPRDELTFRFWGDAVHSAGAGPAPIPSKQLSVDNLTAAIISACSPEVTTAAGVLGMKIRAEKGEERGVKSFTRSMPSEELRYVPIRRTILILQMRYRPSRSRRLDMRQVRS